MKSERIKHIYWCLLCRLEDNVYCTLCNNILELRTCTNSHTHVKFGVFKYTCTHTHTHTHTHTLHQKWSNQWLIVGLRNLWMELMPLTSVMSPTKNKCM